MMENNLIKKTSDNSYFVRCHHSSAFSDGIFNAKPTHDNKDVKVLQILSITNGIIIIELEKIEVNGE